MLAHVRDLAVRRHRWMSDDTFREGLVLCQSIPGPTVMMMTAYVGLLDISKPRGFAPGKVILKKWVGIRVYPKP